jgi:hypothetical protein
MKSRCHIDDCRNYCGFTGIYCSTHMCRKAGCRNSIAKRTLSYCLDHTLCCYDSCDNKTNGHKYCIDHKCFECERLSQPHFKLCEAHRLCGVPLCIERAMNKNFCIFHTCSEYYCNAHTEINKTLCSYHLIK